MARQRVPPQDRQLLQHLQSVAQIAHPAALIVRPAHRHLDHTKSSLDGNKQNFGVETPALDGLKLENGLRRRPRKGLETTLRIGKRQLHHHAANRVETPPEKLPIQRLAMDLAPPPQPARANGNICRAPAGAQTGAGRVPSPDEQVASPAPSARAANRRPASSIGAERSASVTITISPCALRIPART